MSTRKVRNNTILNSPTPAGRDVTDEEAQRRRVAALDEEIRRDQTETLMKILVTTKDKGPEGWDVIPMWDENVFFDPNVVDEIDVITMVEKAKNGDLGPLKSAAEFDLPKWQG